MFMVRNHRLHCELEDIGLWYMTPFFFMKKAAVRKNFPIMILKDARPFIEGQPTEEKLNRILHDAAMEDGETIDEALFTHFEDMEIEFNHKLTDYAVWRIKTDSGREVGLCPVLLGWVLHRMKVSDPVEFITTRMVYLPERQMFLLICPGGGETYGDIEADVLVAGIMALKLTKED